MDDDRYSHERSFSTFVSHTVGNACKFLIEEQIDPRGLSYKSRETPNGNVMGHDVLFEAYVESNYGSYAAWWRNNQNQTLLEMRVEFCNWRINKEKRIGFVDDEQKIGMLKSFDRMLNDAKKPPSEMPLLIPDWYTVDAIVIDSKMLKQYQLAK